MQPNVRPQVDQNPQLNLGQHTWYRQQQLRQQQIMQQQRYPNYPPNNQRASYPQQNPAYPQGGNEQMQGNQNSMYHQQMMLQQQMHRNISPQIMSQQQQRNQHGMNNVISPTPTQMGLNTSIRHPQPSTSMEPSPQQRSLTPASQQPDPMMVPTQPNHPDMGQPKELTPQ